MPSLRISLLICTSMGVALPVSGAVRVTLSTDDHKHDRNVFKITLHGYQEAEAIMFPISPQSFCILPLPTDQGVSART